MHSERGRQSVLFVGPLPPPANGMTVLTESLLASQLTHDFKLTHLDTSDHRDISNVAKIDFTNVYLALRNGLSFLAALVRVRPEIVHVQVARDRLGFLRDALFLIPARLTRRMVVLHLHARGFDEFYRGERWWMRLLIGASISPRWHAAVLSTEFRRTFDGLIPAAQVHVLPNGIPDLGDGGPAAGRRPIVLHLSTMWSLKGSLDVIRAAGVVAASVPGVRFLLAGGWLRDDERTEAETLIGELGIRDVVDLLGPVAGPEKERLFKSAAVFTLPTRYPIEGQPVAVLEALASGTPVVATPTAAIPEMVRNGREGFLVPAEDVDALAQKLIEVLETPELRDRLGRAARKRFEQEYTDERFVDRIAQLWAGLRARTTA